MTRRLAQPYETISGLMIARSKWTSRQIEVIALASSVLRERQGR